MTYAFVRPSRKGFTLVEVFVVVALFGIIAAVALAPAVAVVRRFEDVRAEEAREQRMTYLLRRVPDELRLSPPEFRDGPAVVLVRRDILGGAADDRLAFWSDWGGATGVRAVRLFQHGAGKTGEQGVYLWILPFTAPENVGWDALEPAEGTLLLPKAESLRISLLPHDKKEWEKEYAGARPRSIRIDVSLNKEVFSYEDWLPPE